MKKKGVIILSFVFLVLSLSFASAFSFSDTWNKITGKAIINPLKINIENKTSSGINNIVTFCGLFQGEGTAVMATCSGTWWVDPCGWKSSCSTGWKSVSYAPCSPFCSADIPSTRVYFNCNKDFGGLTGCTTNYNKFSSVPTVVSYAPRSSCECTLGNAWVDITSWKSYCSGTWSDETFNSVETKVDCCVDSDCGEGYSCSNYNCIKEVTNPSHVVDGPCCSYLSSSNSNVGTPGYYYRKADAWCTEPGAGGNCETWTSECSGSWYNNQGWMDKVDCCVDSDCAVREECVNGTCVGEFEIECTQGEIKCFNETHYQLCSSGTCLSCSPTWSVPKSCGLEEICFNGECFNDTYIMNNTYTATISRPDFCYPNYSPGCYAIFKVQISPAEAGVPIYSWRNKNGVGDLEGIQIGVTDAQGIYINEGNITEDNCGLIEGVYTNEYIRAGLANGSKSNELNFNIGCDGCDVDSDCGFGNICVNNTCINSTCGNNICELNETIENCPEDCAPVGENVKDLSKYSDKEVFLISDKNWKDVLPLVSLTTWTGNEDCQKGYGTAEDVCVYPTLIFHEEENTNLYLNFRSGKDENIVDVDVDFGSSVGGYSGKMIFSKQYNLVPGEIIFADYSFQSYSYVVKSIYISQIPDFLEIIEPSGGIFDNLNRVLDDETFEFKFKVKEDADEEMFVSFDIDSSIYFMQQYSTEKITIIGNTPQELDNLLIVEPELGVGINQENIKRISVDNYLSYWKSFTDVVYVEDDYELGLMASTYASLINAPLVIEGYNEFDLTNRNVICVGRVNRDCNENYNLEQLQQKYVDETNTDKIILVNPDDLDIKVNEAFQPDKSGNPIYEIYGKTSLAAPILASAKHEVIISTTATDYQTIDSFIENKINDLKINSEYLTIVASPNTIPETSPNIDTSISHLRSADNYIYGDLDHNNYMDISVGRIFGISISDVSSYISRSIFYNYISNPIQNLYITATSISSMEEESYVLNKVLSQKGYNILFKLGRQDPDTGEYISFPLNWENKDAIFYEDHGSPSWAGIRSSEIPKLDNSLVTAYACLTCAFSVANNQIPGHSFSGRFVKDLFCAHAIRKGAIGYFGSIDYGTNMYTKNLVFNVLGEKMTLGEVQKQRSWNTVTQSTIRNEIYGFVSDTPFGNVILVGDPTIILKDNHQSFPDYDVTEIEPDLFEISYQNLFYTMDIDYDLLKSSSDPNQISTLPQGGWFQGGSWLNGQVISDYEIALPLQHDPENIVGFELIGDTISPNEEFSVYYDFNEGYVIDEGNNKLHIYLNKYVTKKALINIDKEWHELKFRIRVKLK